MWVNKLENEAGQTKYCFIYKEEEFPCTHITLQDYGNGEADENDMEEIEQLIRQDILKNIPEFREGRAVPFELNIYTYDANDLPIDIKEKGEKLMWAAVITLFDEKEEVFTDREAFKKRLEEMEKEKQVVYLRVDGLQAVMNIKEDTFIGDILYWDQKGGYILAVLPWKYDIDELSTYGEIVNEKELMGYTVYLEDAIKRLKKMQG